MILGIDGIENVIPYLLLSHSTDLDVPLKSLFSLQREFTTVCLSGNGFTTLVCNVSESHAKTSLIYSLYISIHSL